MAPSNPKVISLFTGAGGLDYGLEAAGFDVSVGVEMDRDCCRTLRASRPSWRLIEEPIERVTTRRILQTTGLRQGKVDLVVGGPPCQPFSKAGYWANGSSRRLADPRAGTLSELLRVVGEALPRAFLIENVKGIRFSGMDEGVRLIEHQVKSINRRRGTRYALAVGVLNAADFGVPQVRERVFIVGSRDGRTFAFPKRTHGTSEDGASLEPYRTCWDALADVELAGGEAEALRPRGKWAALLSSIPEGQNYLHHTSRGGGAPLFGWRTRYWTFLLKLAKDRPAWTIQAQPGPATGPFHWDNRRLSARELCRLQTFPDDVTIVGDRSSIQRQLGNAVPSLLAEVLGREIRTQLLGLPPRRRGPRLLPPDNGFPPPPTRKSVVPRKYSNLTADHAPHPGTGQGPGARRRHVDTARAAGGR
jgi:DNA (cytosine-5)-methyltransferase 1